MARIRQRCGAGNRRTSPRGFTLLELVVVVLIFGAVVWAAILMLPRRRGTPSTRLVCAANMKGIGTTIKIYANENGGAWPMPAFDESGIGSIRYTVPVGGGQGTPQSPNRAQRSVDGPGGAVELSTTRSYWMLVRSGDITVRQFICPSSGDVDDPTRRIEHYYDFTGYANVSYGYQVPFGLKSSHPREGMDNRMVVAADKGPYIDATAAVPSADLPLAASYPSSPELKAWRAFNSKNHQTEGQNVLYADGHAMFERTPIVGVDNDNIYTAATGDGSTGSWLSGESPWVQNRTPHTIFDRDGAPLASTDSVIFP